MKIKLVVPKGVTTEEADELLYKAIKTKREASSTESFDDELVAEFAEMLVKAHQEMYDDIVNEISKVLES